MAYKKIEKPTWASLQKLYDQYCKEKKRRKEKIITKLACQTCKKFYSCKKICSKINKEIPSQLDIRLGVRYIPPIRKVQEFNLKKKVHSFSKSQNVWK